MIIKVLRINILAQNITALCRSSAKLGLGNLPSAKPDPYMNLHYHGMMGL